jgi:aspartate ammonia-lyase
MATSLSPYVGYAATAELAKESVRTGIPIHQLALDRKLLDADRLDQILDPEAMTRPGIAGTDGTASRPAGKQPPKPSNRPKAKQR